MHNYKLIIIAAVISMYALGVSAQSSSHRSQRFIDVSHEIVDSMITYKGIPPPVISAQLTREESTQRYAPGTQFLISKICLVANTGTYLDSPFHRYENGKQLSELSLEDLAYVPAVIVRIDGDKIKEIDEAYFKKLELKGKALLIHTGWDKNWGKPSYFENHPHLTESAAVFLRNSGVRIVAIDTYNIDDVVGKVRPAHSNLLAAGILIVEHLCNLDKVPSGKEIEFNAVPVKIRNFSTFPVRAFVYIKGNLN